MIFVLIIVTAVTAFPSLKGPYLGQKAPDGEAAVFLDGILSTLDEPQMNAAFTEDGKEFYFCARHRGHWAIFVTKEVGGRWSYPEPLPFTSDYTDRDFTISPDGNRLYFGSDRPRRKGGPRLERLDIFYTKRSADGSWSAPENAGPVINTDAGENYPSVTRGGNLYFFSCRGDGIGGCDLYVAKSMSGHYQTPVVLGEAINSKRNDWDAFVAPDESYMIFSSQERADTMGGQDLYISYRREDGTWTGAKNMGGRVNSESGEICPIVTLDGKYLFFTSRRRGKADIYWMTSDIIEDLRP